VDPLATFGDAARAWFARTFPGPTPVQARGWAAIAAGRHTLMLAPTGSGKTLAAFLWALDRLARSPGAGTRVVYISPIKALAYDIERNLRAPLAGMGLSIQVDLRTGDTPAKERERQRKDPGQILVTTPESLYLVLASRSRERLRAVDTIIVDEIHALAPTKRGIHLALTLERLAQLVRSSDRPEPQRIGLSATQRPLTEVARYLGGDRDVEIVDASARPALDLELVVPAAQMDQPGTAAKDGGGMWPLIYPRLLDEILAHRSTIIFVNSRRLAERVAQQLTELAATRGIASHGDLVRAHHGSIARHQRLEIEEALKDGRLRAITATSSLELGIDMGAVDLVLQVESPGAVSRGLQRIGRASHQVGGTSRGRIFPKFRGDLLEATVVAHRMLDGEVEAIRVPEGALDVLAQQIVAMVGVEPWRVRDLDAVVRRAASYRELPHAALVSVIEMLAGKYPSDEMAELRPRLTWDRQADVLTARRGALLLSVVSGGTIPDRGLYAVHLGEGGPKVGELDEEMVAESRKGETFLLGASTWRIEDITRDRVIVSPAPGEPGKMPFWRAEGPGRPVELGRALGGFCRELDARIATGADAARAWLMTDYHLDAFAADNLVAYLAEQRAAAGSVPSDRAITIERFRDELGDVRVCILSPFGSRVHAPWALVLAHQLEQRLGYPVHPLWTDDGIAVRFAEQDAQPSDDELVPDPDEIERLLVDELARSSMFASHFRENAARALLLPRRRPGQRTPLWAQRLRAQQLMGVALRFPSFPVTLETYREVLRDVFDLPSLIEVLRGVRSQEIRLEAAHTETASPFARSLVFDYVAAFLYEGDAPLAERKAQALTLDRNLLRELIGGGELRELLDLEVIAEVEAELQQLADERKARDTDELHDLLRRLGDLSLDELKTRFVGVSASVSVSDLVNQGRAAMMTIAGSERAIDADDAVRYHAALSLSLTPTLALTPTLEEPLVSLVQRYARTHGPFQAEAIAQRWGLPAAAVEPVLALLEARGQLVRGDLRPGGSGIDRCDPEVLRLLRRRTLVKLRAQVAPVADATFSAFLPRWHGLDSPRRGIGALRDAIARLEGVALPFSELEARLLPARIVDYHPRMLDELGAAGELVWVGAGALGQRDGRVILLRRDRARALAPEPRPLAEPSPVHAAITDHLARAGASFLVALEQAANAPRAAVTAALWDLVWAGVITNDTFAPLRSLGAKAARRVSAHAAFGGRWSLVSAFGAAGAAAPNGSMTRGGAQPTATTRAHAQATALLERWGIASRPGARADELPGGFAAVADVLRAMEDAGTVRRGFFVAGLEGAQFAWPAAVDRLREPPRGQAPRVDLLSAVDPACAWGSALPWPALRDPDARPARRVGATVVQVDGVLALWIEANAKRIATAADASDETIERALAVGLPQLAARRRRRELLIETIDGTSASQSRWQRAIAGRVDYRGVIVTQPAPL
jgi:ATP-dependent Lhr-like helicase